MILIEPRPFVFGLFGVVYVLGPLYALHYAFLYALLYVLLVLCYALYIFHALPFLYVVTHPCRTTPDVEHVHPSQPS